MLTRIGSQASRSIAKRSATIRSGSAHRHFAAASVKKDLAWYNSELNKSLKMRYFPQAIQLFKEMKSQNIEPNPTTYEIVFSVYSETKDSESAAEMMADLKAKGVSTILQQLEDQVKSLGDSREDIDKAFRLFSRFERLKQAGVNVFSSP